MIENSADLTQNKKNLFKRIQTFDKIVDSIFWHLGFQLKTSQSREMSMIFTRNFDQGGITCKLNVSYCTYDISYDKLVEIRCIQRFKELVQRFNSENSLIFYSVLNVND